MVEPAGVAAVAAIMAHPEVFTPPVVAVLSGGNIDPLVLLHVTQHGLVAARRFLSLRLEIIDRPGSLAALLALVGELGGNVVDVEHPGWARRCRWATSRSRCGWRPGVRRTARRSSRRWPRPASGSSNSAEQLSADAAPTAASGWLTGRGRRVELSRRRAGRQLSRRTAWRPAR